MCVEFEQLSTELVLQILFSISDLRSLYNIVRTSPRAYRIFQKYAVEIINIILRSGAIAPHTRNIICIIAGVRSGHLLSDLVKPGRWIPEDDVPGSQYHTRDDKFRYSGINTLFLQYVNKHYGILSASMSGGACTVEHISPDTKAHVMLSILATSQQVTALSQGYLDYYLERYRKLRPITLKDTNRAHHKWRSPYTSCENPHEYTVPHTECEVDQCLKMTDYIRTKDQGAPLWIEWQRVLRSFWRIQLLHDLKYAAFWLFPDWDWMELECLEHVGILAFYECCRNSGFRSDGKSLGYEEFTLVIEYMYANHGQIWPDCVSKDTINAQIPWADYVQPAQPKDEALLLRPAPRAGYTPQMLAYGADEKQIPPFGSYRRLGFAFWSQERLVGFGLYSWKGWHSKAFLYTLSRHACLSLHTADNTYPDPLKREQAFSCAAFPCDAKSRTICVSYVSRKPFNLKVDRRLLRKWSTARMEWKYALGKKGGIWPYVFIVVDFLFRMIRKFI